MNKEKIKTVKRNRRRAKISIKVKGGKERPRLSIFKSSKNIYVQIIDDSIGKTILSAHSREIKLRKTKAEVGESRNMQIGFELGKLIAQKALAKKITSIVFDRGGFKYHGRVKAVAEGAREGGLKF